MASAALSALAATAPRDLTRDSDLGRIKSHELVIQCQIAGLAAPVDASNDVAVLHALFDIALQNGLGSVVYDYVVEVAADKYCTSSDPIKAYLLDGECVKEWCRNALEREQNHVLQGLSRGLASLSGAGQLHKHVARLGALMLIVEALHPAGPERKAQQLPADLQLAQQLHQSAMMLEWAAQHVQGIANGPGRFESEPAWRMAVSKRRAAATPDTTFLQDMQQALTGLHGCRPLHYPPASVEKAAQALFLSGATSQSAWQAKLTMLVYYLMDAGLTFSEHSFMQAFHVRPAQLVEWTAYFQLDDALAGSQNSLERACQSLPAVAGPGSSFKLVQSLAALGRHMEALTLLRARQSVSRAPQEPDQALQEALVGLSTRLSCNLLTEAFMEAQQHCNAVHPEQRAAHARQLVSNLADWAEAHRALNAVIQLPLNQLEEEMLVNWLKERVREGRPAGRYLVLLYLVRGRLPEALNAHRELLSSLPAGQSEDDGPLASLAVLLESASALVPDQARAATQYTSSIGSHDQHLTDLFSTSLLPKAAHKLQQASLQSAWPQGTSAQDIQAEPAFAPEALQSASQQREQQEAAAAADDVGTSWAAWRADQTAEEPGKAFGQAMDGLEGAQGEQGAMSWQHIIVPPGSRNAARTVKRPKVHRPR